MKTVDSLTGAMPNTQLDIPMAHERSVTEYLVAILERRCAELKENSLFEKASVQIVTPHSQKWLFGPNGSNGGSSLPSTRICHARPLKICGQHLGDAVLFSRARRLYPIFDAVVDYAVRVAELEMENLQEAERCFKIQRNLLLGQVPDNSEMLEIGTLAIPSRNISGDFFDFFAHSPTTTDFVLGDVMGKGTQAALIGAALKSHLARYANANLQSSCRRCASYELLAPQQIVSQLHREMSPQLIELETFATLCYARFSAAARQMTLVDCGHPKVLHYHIASDTVRELDGDNFPLGFQENAVINERVFTFVPRDVFLFYSDGITEARNARNEYFGTERLSMLLHEYSQASCHELLAQIRRAVRDFCESDHCQDDISCIAVKIKERRMKENMSEMLLVYSKLPELARVRMHIRNMCRTIPHFEKNEQELHNLTLVANEIVANIIQHNYQERERRSIRIYISVFASKIEIDFVDRGVPFELPSKDQIPDLAQLSLESLREKERGFGMYLIYQLVDEITYKRESDHNCVHIVKSW